MARLVVESGRLVSDTGWCHECASPADPEVRRQQWEVATVNLVRLEITPGRLGRVLTVGVARLCDLHLREFCRQAKGSLGEFTPTLSMRRNRPELDDK